LRSRWAILAAALLLSFMTVPQAIAAPRGFVVAQADQDDAETQGEDGGGEQDGRGDEEAETGTEEGESAGSGAETGPPWTFQMARIILVLSVLLGLAIMRWYWKLVGSRQRTT
jgi:hypothetical protein